MLVVATVEQDRDDGDDRCDPGLPGLLLRPPA